MPTESNPSVVDLPSTPPTQTESPSSSTTTPEQPSPSAKGSFISDALSALKQVSETDSPTTPQAETLAPAEDKAPPPESSTPSLGDDDAKAEADIKKETANMSAAHRAAFTKLRYEARDLKRQLKAAQQAEATLKNPAPDETTKAPPEELIRLSSENEALKSKLGEFEKEVFTSRLESTEVFKNEVAVPRDSVAQQISEVVKRYEGLDQEAVVSAVRTAEPERVSRITADMTEFDRYRFYNLVEQFQGINAREAQLRNQSRDVVERSFKEQREQEEKRSAEEKSQWEKALSGGWEKLEDEFPVLAPVDGDEDWNEKIQSIRSFAAPDRFSNLTVSERVAALHRAAAFPVVVAELEATMEELKGLQERLSKYEGATPGVNSGSGSPEASSPSISGEGAFVESALASLRKVGYR